jgi:hypothetical protein
MTYTEFAEEYSLTLLEFLNTNYSPDARALASRLADLLDEYPEYELFFEENCLAVGELARWFKSK